MSQTTSAAVSAKRLLRPSAERYSKSAAATTRPTRRRSSRPRSQAPPGVSSIGSLAQREGSTRTSACHSSIVGFPNATIITVRRRQPLDGLRPASQMAPGLFPFRTYLDAHVFSKLSSCRPALGLVAVTLNAQLTTPIVKGAKFRSMVPVINRHLTCFRLS